MRVQHGAIFKPADGLAMPHARLGVDIAHVMIVMRLAIEAKPPASLQLRRSLQQASAIGDRIVDARDYEEFVGEFGFAER